MNQKFLFKAFLLRYQMFLRSFLLKEALFDEKNIINQINNLKTREIGLLELKIECFQIALSAYFLIFTFIFLQKEQKSVVFMR